jgi:hypothetical protein
VYGRGVPLAGALASLQTSFRVKLTPMEPTNRADGEGSRVGSHRKKIKQFSFGNTTHATTFANIVA